MENLKRIPFKRSTLGKISDRFKLWWMTKVLIFKLIILGLVYQERMSHNNAIAGSGSFTPDPDPEIPDHPYFKKGNEYPCQIRHGAATFYDDAMSAIRSISIKTAKTNWEESLDIELNTGSVGLFWNAASFIKLANLRRERYGIEYSEYYKKYPAGKEGARRTLRRDPSSFTNLVYYNKTPLYFNSNGETRYVKYKVVPFDDVKESGLVEKNSAQWIEPENQRIDPLVNPLTQKFLKGELGHASSDDTMEKLKEYPNPLPRNYLKDEFAHRVKRQAIVGNPVKYRLQAQIRPKKEDEDELIFNCCVDWDEEKFPFRDLGVIMINKVMNWEESNKLTFSFNNLPKSLGVLPAKSIYDYNSLNYLRKKSDIAKKARLLSYKLKGNPPDIPNDDNRNSFTILDKARDDNR